MPAAAERLNVHCLLNNFNRFVKSAVSNKFFMIEE
jgi:hypothetical protein